MTTAEIQDLIERSKDDHAIIVGSEIRAVASYALKVAEELEQYRMRLAGALTTVEGNMLDFRDDPWTADYLRTCPTIDACIRVRRRLEALEASNRAMADSHP